MTKMSWDWLLGFIEGEGNFQIGIRKDKKKDGIRYQVIPIFQISQSTFGNNRVLYEIQKFLKENGIRANVYERRNKDKKLGIPQTLAMCYLHVYGIPNLFKLANIIDKLEWHTPKKCRFDIWYKALQEMEKTYRQDKDINYAQRMLEYKKQISHPYANRPIKWTHLLTENE